jgi:hypothetical protein
LAAAILEEGGMVVVVAGRSVAAGRQAKVWRGAT